MILLNRLQVSRGARGRDSETGIEPRRPPVLLQLRGDQPTMGAQHGEALCELGGWEAAVNYYPRLVERMLRGSGTDPVERALPSALRPVVELALGRMDGRRPEALRARSQAFMRALGRDPAHARHMQIMDVFQNIIGTLGRWHLGPFAEQIAMRIPPACSTLAVWGQASASGRLLHARNFDFPGVGVWDKAPMVVMCTPESGLRYGFTTTRGADAPGVTAFNEAGICLTVHTRLHHAVSFDGMAIIDLGHEIARRASTLAQALQVARERRIASTWGLLISSAAEQDARVVEVHADGLRVTRPEPAQPWLSCTNHYLHPDMHAGELQLSPGWSMHTGGRLHTLQRAARAAHGSGGLDVDDLKTLLGSHADPDLPGSERAAGGVLGQCTSVQSVVFDLEDDAVHLSVGDTPTGLGPWLRVPLGWADSPGCQLLSVPNPTAPPVQAQQPLDASGVGHYRRGAAQVGMRHFVEAGRLEAAGESPEAIQAEVEAAAKADPAEPTWRYLKAGIHLRTGETAAALCEFERALCEERSPFYRGQMLLWASRAAQGCGRAAQAKRYRQELLAMPHPWLARHQRRARLETERPLGARRLRRTTVHVQLADLGV